jgi:hypothetical protein
MHYSSIVRIEKGISMKRKIWWLLLVMGITLALVTSHFWVTKASSAKATSNAVTSNDVTYHRGAVMAGTTQVYVIFWEPDATPPVPNHHMILNYFQDVGASPLYHNNMQYTDAQGNYPSGVNLGGSWIDKTPYAYNSLTPGTIAGTQIIAEIQHGMQVNQWTGAPNHLFVVYTTPSLNNDTKTGYHAIFHDNPSNTDVIYATIPGIFGDGTLVVTSHEEIEAATDPAGGGWLAADNEEVGDLCGGDAATVQWRHGHHYNQYVVQNIWDNATHSCTVAGP